MRFIWIWAYEANFRLQRTKVGDIFCLPTKLKWNTKRKLDTCAYLSSNSSGVDTKGPIEEALEEEKEKVWVFSRSVLCFSSPIGQYFVSRPARPPGPVVDQTSGPLPSPPTSGRHTSPPPITAGFAILIRHTSTGGHSIGCKLAVHSSGGQICLWFPFNWPPERQILFIFLSSCVGVSRYNCWSLVFGVSFPWPLIGRPDEGSKKLAAPIYDPNY